jgi:hypothetical protein
MLGRWRGTPRNDTRDVELNAIGVLKRRETEARILAPVVEALGREFGREKVLQIVRETIVGIASDQGRQLVQISGGFLSVGALTVAHLGKKDVAVDLVVEQLP